MKAPWTVVVSGASRGLGLEIVAHLLERGCRCAGFARSGSDGLKALEARSPGRLHFEALDATDEDGLRRFVAAVIERFGTIHALVNNAAVGQDQMLAHLSPAAIARLLDVNLRAPILLTREVTRRMLTAGTPGRIVNISSICGSRGYAGLTVYAAAKGGLEAFTRSLARELGPRGILVNAIAPGFFASEMSHVLSQAQVETIRRRTPTERMIGPADLLPALDMLLFEETNITGQVITVDGGIGA